VHRAKNKSKQEIRKAEQRVFQGAAWGILACALGAASIAMSIANIRAGKLSVATYRTQALGPVLQLLVGIPLFAYGFRRVWRCTTYTPEKRHARHKVLDPLERPNDEK
jgi:ABC-type phosphate transport system permease subunit